MPPPTNVLQDAKLRQRNRVVRSFSFNEEVQIFPFASLAVASFHPTFPPSTEPMCRFASTTSNHDTSVRKASFPSPTSSFVFHSPFRPNLALHRHSCYVLSLPRGLEHEDPERTRPEPSELTTELTSTPPRLVVSTTSACRRSGGGSLSRVFALALRAKEECKGRETWLEEEERHLAEGWKRKRKGKGRKRR